MVWDHRIVCVDGIYSIYEVYYDSCGKPFGKAQIDLTIDPEWDGSEPVATIAVRLIEDLKTSTQKSILSYPKDFDGEMPSLRRKP